ncbi:hypothetical protein [Thermus caldilimi]|uniref:hypothetical protein n=1 Tax=Thermus caldilimi TaxID=2483360 RepID=UPI001076B7AD|nr:hypothetical protein [Thermus caldilimi]
MRAKAILVGAVLTFVPGAFPAKANGFWDTLGGVLNSACSATYDFNFGGNWDWICTLRSVYGNFRWIAENFQDYVQDFAIQAGIGVIEGFMQSLGWYIGPGVNQFVDQIADAAQQVRRAPQLLRRAIARAMLEDAKVRHIPLTGRYPTGSPPDLLVQQAQSNPTIAGGFLGDYLEEVKDIGKRVAAIQATSNLSEELKKSNETIGELTSLVTKVVTPKEAEQTTGGVVRAGVADQLVDKAKTAASTREVMEATVEGISYLLRLQAATSPILVDFLQKQVQAQLYTNGSLVGLYDEIAALAEKDSGEAEYELQAYAVAVEEGAREAENELRVLGERFQSLVDMADNLPDGGSLSW